MSTKVYDDDAEGAVRSGKAAPAENIVEPAEQAAAAGVSSLAEALRRNERRKRRLAIRSYLSIIALGVCASLAIYAAQVYQIRQLNDRGYHACLVRNQQFAAEYQLIKVIADTTTNEEVAAAARMAIASMPPPANCAEVWGFEPGTP